MTSKQDFETQLKDFVNELQEHISTKDGQWTIKGFIDVYKNIYTISSDTKIVSKILEIHLFPKILEFAKDNGYKVVLADHQNYYPDISFGLCCINRQSPPYSRTWRKKESNGISLKTGRPTTKR